MRRMEFAAVVVAIASCLIVISVRPQAAAQDSTAQAAGFGERILLVVADVTSPTDAPQRRDELNRRFGSLRGFSVDRSDAYDVSAALVQTSADATSVACSRVDAPFKATVGGETVHLDCFPGFKRVLVDRDVRLKYVAKRDFGSFGFPSPCGHTGEAPCQRSRFVDLFGTTLTMPRSTSIVATAFRTRAGAQEFIAFARAAGVRGLVTVQALKLGGGDVGLGQEAHPDGSGPLEGPLADQEELQR